MKKYSSTPCQNKSSPTKSIKFPCPPLFNGFQLPPPPAGKGRTLRCVHHNNKPTY